MHNSNLVVEAAIFDFYNKSKLVNRDSTFNVSTSNLNSQILKVVIIGDTNKFYFEDGKPLNRIPNNFVEIKGKLFYWTDSNNEIAENLVLKKLKFYNLVEYDKDIIITHLDHDRKAVTYYFCRNNLNQLKKLLLINPVLYQIHYVDNIIYSFRNLRISYKKNGYSTEITDQNDYYSVGMSHVKDEKPDDADL